ncbi:MAG: threonine/serine dehydratase [Caldilineaceae bacterium]|nr:threonine/serine dehydratase [Caldilineaceae bacterium]
MGAATRPTFHDILRAQKTIRPYLAPTPLYHYPMLDQLLGAEVYVKHENYLPIGAFKIRGGINFMAHLPADIRSRGVVTASTGNHGQSIAYAAQQFGVRAMIVVPEGANPVKVEAMRGYGAEVVFHGADFEASKRHCVTIEREQGLRFINSGDEPLLIAGVGTHTLEILQEQPDIDVLLVPLGGGSGAAGACIAAKAMSPHIQVIAVQAAGAPAGYLTWQARAARTAAIHTFAGGLATGEPFMMPQTILWDLLDDFILIEDEEMRVAIRFYLEKAKTLAEPAGAAALAAAIKMRDQLQGKKVALILSGGNISPAELSQALIG